jgi:hypothetical protein
MDRLMGMLHTLPANAQDAIRTSLSDADPRHYRLGHPAPEKDIDKGPGGGGAENSAAGEIETR